MINKIKQIKMEIYGISRIRLTNDEAKALHAVTEGSCPAGLFSLEKRVWWILEDEATGTMPVTICPLCYDANRFNGYEKEILIPHLMEGIPCCCDGPTYEESFPSKINDQISAGLYGKNPDRLLGGIDLSTQEDHLEYLVRICVKKETLTKQIKLGVRYTHQDNEKELIPIAKRVESTTDFNITVYGVSTNGFDNVMVYNRSQKLPLVFTIFVDGEKSEFTVNISDEEQSEISEQSENSDEEITICI